MEIDLAITHGWITAELARNQPVADSMARLIDQCENARPHSDWRKLRNLPYEELSHMLEWIQTPFREEPSKARLKGLWFGLFNPCPNGTPVADIYVCGSKRFEPDFNDNSWAVGPDWWPEARYASSSILADVYRIAYQVGGSDAKRKNCLGNDAEYPLCLGFGTFAVRHLLACVEPALLLGKSKSIGIAVGFDSGDFVLLGEFSPHGLHPIDPRSPKPEKSIGPVLKDLRSSNKDRAFRAVYGV